MARSLELGCILLFTSCISLVYARNDHHRSLLQNSRRNSMPPLKNLQGVWSGTRKSAAFITWDKDSGIFDANCIRNDDITLLAMFGRDAVKNGTISYDSTMQLLNTLGGDNEIKQTYTTPTDYVKDGGDTILVAGLNPFLGGYTGKVDNYTSQAVIYNVEGLGKNTLGCLDWTISIDKKKKEVKLRQIEAFRVEINNGRYAVLYSNICNDGQFSEPQCVVDIVPKMKNDTTIDTQINGTSVDPFIYCMTDNYIDQGEYPKCFDVIAPAFANAFDNMESAGKLESDSTALLCQAWKSTNHEFNDDDYEKCFNETRAAAVDLLNSETKAMEFCKLYVTCESCEFCSKYGYSCMVCYINLAAFDTELLAGLGSMDVMAGVTLQQDGIFQSADTNTGDQMELSDWADLVDKFNDLPRVRPDEDEDLIGVANITEPVRQWMGFLDNIDLEKGKYMETSKDEFAILYGGRFMNAAEEFEKKIITATVVTEYSCTAGPCLELLKEDKEKDRP